MLVNLALAGPAVTAPVVTQFKVSVPEPPLIASREVNVPAGALYESLPVVLVVPAEPTRAVSTPVVSGQVKHWRKALI